MARRDSYDNRIDEVMMWDATNERTPFTIKDGLAASISWDLPPAYCAIVRSRWPDGSIKERSYRNPKAAHKYMVKCLENNAEFTLLTDDALRDSDHPTDKRSGSS